MNDLTIFCPAKVNLTLDIVGKRSDGYHLMDMVMQTVSLGDTLKIHSSDEDELSLNSGDFVLPEGKQNLVICAAEEFLKYAAIPIKGYHFHLLKRIPSQAGLGGGSADAAGVLFGLNQLTGREYSLPVLMKIGEKVGADVPFCLLGGTALVQGIGERVTPLSALPDCFLVIAKPNSSNNTALAFSEYDRQGQKHYSHTNEMIAALQSHSLSRISAAAHNVFENTAGNTETVNLKETMLRFGAFCALMTGSGSAVFSLFESADKAKDCTDALRRAKTAAFLCRPCRQGPYLV